MAGRAATTFSLKRSTPVIRSLAGNVVNSQCPQHKSEISTFHPKQDLMLPRGTFDGKIAFVTGGGTGLGRGMVKTLSALGAKVAIMSRLA